MACQMEEKVCFSHENVARQLKQAQTGFYTEVNNLASYRKSHFTLCTGS